jgi:hypothetical protein
MHVFYQKRKQEGVMKHKLIMILSLIFAVMSAMFFSSCTSQPEEAADLVLTNGKIVTMDVTQPEAAALAALDEKILAVGEADDIEKYIDGNTQVLDLEGRLAVPGLIDSHAHFMSIGQAKLGLELMDAESWQEIVDMVDKAAGEAEPGEWVIGRGWHQEKWRATPQPNVDGLPYHDDLSAVSPDNPVMLGHASGHSLFANAKAMELAGIDQSTQAPEGGEIVRNPQGNPIGVFRETAQWLVREAYYASLEQRTPEEELAERKKVIELADQECLSKGLTSVHDAGVSYSTIDLYKEFVQSDRLGIRIYAMINEDNAELEEKIADYRIEGMGNHHLSVGAVKRLIDGALGAHGAWLLEPYKDLPSSTGLNTTPVPVIQESARIAIENGFQLCVHAIGDRANRETLDIYEKAFQAHPDKQDLRWRIEHAQHLSLQDIPRFGELDVIASMQAIHCASDGPWVYKRLGAKRAEEGAYVWQKLMDDGVIICNGTDAPVEDVDPIPCFYASVTRMMPNGEAFFPEQAMSREEALRSYTINGAYAAFQEDILGSLTPGKYADITVLSQDIMTIPAEDIPKTEVLYTIVGGDIKYQK